MGKFGKFNQTGGKAARTATNDALRNSLAALWVKLAKSCA